MPDVAETAPVADVAHAAPLTDHRTFAAGTVVDIHAVSVYIARMASAVEGSPVTVAALKSMAARRGTSGRPAVGDTSPSSALTGAPAARTAWPACPPGRAATGSGTSDTATRCSCSAIAPYRAGATASASSDCASASSHRPRATAPGATNRTAAAGATNRRRSLSGAA
jgi:hypothetical protein